MNVNKYVPLGDIELKKNSYVKLTDMGNIKEVMYNQRPHTGGTKILKVNKDQYMDKETGEVKDYKHYDSRQQNTDYLRVTFKKLRHLINYNFKGAKNELMFTITYAENMTDTKRLYNDFKNFMKRLKYRYGDIDYINVVEPQGRGAWHCHVLLRFNDLKTVYIPNKEIEAIWGNGFTKVKKLKNDVDNMGAYLSAYLGDLELNDNNVELVKSMSSGENINSRAVIKEVEVEGKKKKFIKGARLALYPAGMQIYRKSKGITEPPVQKMSYEKVKKIVGAATPNYNVVYTIYDDDGTVVNTIVIKQYNMKRQKCSMETGGVSFQQ